MANAVERFTIGSGETQSNGVAGQGKRLMGLSVPTMTSTQITFQHSADGGSTWRDVKDHDDSSPATIDLGAADTGDKAVHVPDSVSKLSATGMIRLVVSSQGSERVVLGLYERLY